MALPGRSLRYAATQKWYSTVLSTTAPDPVVPGSSSVCDVGARSLLAGAFAVVAPRPAAGPTLTFLKLLLGSANAAFSGHLLLCILDPANELVAGQRRDAIPGSERRRVGDQRFAQVFRKFVHHPTGHSFSSRTGSNELFGPSQGRFLPEDWRSREIDTVGAVGLSVRAPGRARALRRRARRAPRRRARTRSASPSHRTCSLSGQTPSA